MNAHDLKQRALVHPEYRATIFAGLDEWWADGAFTLEEAREKFFSQVSDDHPSRAVLEDLLNEWWLAKHPPVGCAPGMAVTPTSPLVPSTVFSSP